jgi:hypothetical protein
MAKASWKGGGAASREDKGAETWEKPLESSEASKEGEV